MGEFVVDDVNARCSAVLQSLPANAGVTITPAMVQRCRDMLLDDSVGCMRGAHDTFICPGDRAQLAEKMQRALRTEVFAPVTGLWKYFAGLTLGGGVSATQFLTTNAADSATTFGGLDMIAVHGGLRREYVTPNEAWRGGVDLGLILRVAAWQAQSDGEFAHRVTGFGVGPLVRADLGVWRAHIASFDFFTIGAVQFGTLGTSGPIDVGHSTVAYSVQNTHRLLFTSLLGGGVGTHMAFGSLQLALRAGVAWEYRHYADSIHTPDETVHIGITPHQCEIFGSADFEF